MRRINCFPVYTRWPLAHYERPSKKKKSENFITVAISSDKRRTNNRMCKQMWTQIHPGRCARLILNWIYTMAIIKLRHLHRVAYIATMAAYNLDFTLRLHSLWRAYTWRAASVSGMINRDNFSNHTLLSTIDSRLLLQFDLSGGNDIDNNDRLGQVLGHATRALAPYPYTHICYRIPFKIGQLLNGFEFGLTIYRLHFRRPGETWAIAWHGRTQMLSLSHTVHGRSPHTNIMHTFVLMKSVWIVIWRYCGPIVTSEPNVNFINNTWIRLPLCLCESRAWLTIHNTYWTRTRVTQFEIPTE